MLSSDFFFFFFAEQTHFMENPIRRQIANIMFTPFKFLRQLEWKQMHYKDRQKNGMTGKVSR